MKDEIRRLRDARSYDEAALVYERVNAPRYFDAPARALVAAASPSPNARILDVGSGTGAVARAARALALPDAFIAAVDPSIAMLLAARRGGVDPLVVGSLPNLPFVRASFDVVLSAFVLTHVDDADAALRDLARVLRPEGRIAVSAWAQAEDEFTAAWSDVVARFVTVERMSRAADVILPGEFRFSKPRGVADALIKNGFLGVESHDVDLSFQVTVDEYVEGREVCASGRTLQTLLSPDEWRRFRAEVRTALVSRFPGGVAYTRRVYIATGRLPAR